MHGVFSTKDPWLHAAHVTVPATDIMPGMVVQVTEFDLYRDPATDRLVESAQTWQAQVEDNGRAWNAPSERFVSFTGGGPGAWVLASADIPLVMGPLNSHGRF